VVAGVVNFLSSWTEIHGLTADQTTGHVYVLLSGDEVTYVGQTTGLAQRLNTHRRGTCNEEPKKFDRVFALEVLVKDLRAIEAALIRRFNPPGVGGGAMKDETRDEEILARFGLKPDRAARDAYKARIHEVFSTAHKRSVIREWSRRHYRPNHARFARILMRAATKAAALVEENRR
jgi:hypothetical protein